jgi:hypothetical protein
MKELDEIDQLFQTTFEGFELTPDASVKNHIDHAIASKKKRRRFLFIWFPILFGSSVLAAIGYFHSFSGKSISKGNQFTQNQTPKHTHSSVFSENRENKEISQAKNVGGNTNSKRLVQREDPKIKVTETKRILAKTQSASSSKNKGFIISNDKPLESKTGAIQPTNSKSKNSEADPSITKTEERAPLNPESKTPQNPIQDSLTATVASDSSSLKDLTTVTETPTLSPEVKKEHSKWSLSVLTGWENESKKPAERFDSTEFSGTSKEYARIHSTSFYGKIEFNRSISTNLDVIMGLGFRSSRITQYGTLYSLDSFAIYENVSSVPLADSFGYFIRKQNETRIYQVNSIIVPLGISYSIPLGKTFRFRISGGTELAYSWMTEKQSAPKLSSSRLNAFGLNVWLRPEIHYTFGKFQLFGFGTFNQPLLQQLKWDFTVRRNPAFGAGIGLMIRL